MALYANVDGAQKVLNDLYTNIDGVQNQLNAMYASIGGSRQQIYDRIYTWSKYTSYRYKTTYAKYETYYSVGIPNAKKIYIFNTDQIVQEEGIIEYDAYDNLVLTYYENFSYSNTTGKFSLINSHTITTRTSEGISLSNYTIESQLIGKYVAPNLRVVYKITGHDDVHVLFCSERYEPGQACYWYTYGYDGDVTSTDPNAYAEGDKSDYMSYDSNDIRTVYVRK